DPAEEAPGLLRDGERGDEFPEDRLHVALDRLGDALLGGHDGLHLALRGLAHDRPREPRGGRLDRLLRVAALDPSRGDGRLLAAPRPRTHPRAPSRPPPRARPPRAPATTGPAPRAATAGAGPGLAGGGGAEKGRNPAAPATHAAATSTVSWRSSGARCAAL